MTPSAGLLRAPALPRLRAGWRLLSFFLAALLGGSLYFAWTSPAFRVSSVTLSGNQMLSAEEVNAVLGLRDAPIFLVLPEKAGTSLRLNFPEIASAEVTVSLPNKVAATIVERLPVIAWEQGGGYAWVDAQGVAFRPRGERADLIVVSASGSPPAGPKSESDPLAPVPFVAPQIVEAVRRLAPYVPAGSALLYDPNYGLGWNDGRGWTAWFGSDASQLEVKLRVYTVLVASLEQRGITPILINVAYPDAPYYRLGQ